MTQYLYLAVFLAGLLCGAGPTRFYYEAKEDARALTEAEAAIDQEKKNVAVVTYFQDALSGVLDHYQRNPVRVRIQGGQASPGCPPPRPEDILLTVGGYQGSVATNAVQ